MIQALLTYLIFLPNVVPPLSWLRSETLTAFPVETFPWAFFFCLSPKLVLDRTYIILMAVFAVSMGFTIMAYGQLPMRPDRSLPSSMPPSYFTASWEQTARNLRV